MQSGAAHKMSGIHDLVRILNDIASDYDTILYYVRNKQIRGPYKAAILNSIHE